MNRYVYTIERRRFVFYEVDGAWFHGRGCHMRAFAAWGRKHPHQVLRHRPPVS